MRAILIVLVAASFSVACSGGDSQKQAEPAAGESVVGEQQLFEGKGVVEVIDLDEGQVMLAHEDIEGFMNAMTMAFDVQNTAILEELEEGMQVNFTVVVEADGTYYINRIER